MPASPDLPEEAVKAAARMWAATLVNRAYHRPVPPPELAATRNALQVAASAIRKQCTQELRARAQGIVEGWQEEGTLQASSSDIEAGLDSIFEGAPDA